MLVTLQKYLKTGEINSLDYKSACCLPVIFGYFELISAVTTLNLKLIKNNLSFWKSGCKNFKKTIFIVSFLVLASFSWARNMVCSDLQMIFWYIYLPSEINSGNAESWKLEIEKSFHLSIDWDWSFFPFSDFTSLILEVLSGFAASHKSSFFLYIQLMLFDPLNRFGSVCIWCKGWH